MEGKKKKTQPILISEHEIDTSFRHLCLDASAVTKKGANTPV